MSDKYDDMAREWWRDTDTTLPGGYTSLAALLRSVGEGRDAVTAGTDARFCGECGRPLKAGDAELAKGK